MPNSKASWESGYDPEAGKGPKRPSWDKFRGSFSAMIKKRSPMMIKENPNYEKIYRALFDHKTHTITDKGQ